MKKFKIERWTVLGIDKDGIEEILFTWRGSKATALHRAHRDRREFGRDDIVTIEAVRSSELEARHDRQPA